MQPCFPTTVSALAPWEESIYALRELRGRLCPMHVPGSGSAQGKGAFESASRLDDVLSIYDPFGMLDRMLENRRMRAKKADQIRPLVAITAIALWFR